MQSFTVRPTASAQYICRSPLIEGPLLNSSFPLTTTETVLPVELINVLNVLNNLMVRPTGLISVSASGTPSACSSPITPYRSPFVHLLDVDVPQRRFSPSLLALPVFPG